MGRNESLGPIMTLLLVFALIGVLFVLARFVLRSLGVGQNPRDEKPGRLPPRSSKPPQQATPAWLWILLIASMAITFWASGSAKGPKQAAPLSPAVLFPWLILGLLAFAILFLYLLSYDRVIHRVLKRANAGDPDTAIAWIQAAIQKRRTADRVNLLACLYIAKKQFLEAHDLLLEAQKLGLDQTLFQSNLALTHKGLGRFEEALALLELQVHRPKAMLNEVCLYCELLIELKRFEAARDQLARAEALYQETAQQSPAFVKEARLRLDACRDQLSMAFPAKSNDLFAEL
jgi:tetratricopeptide (TPR) repeat protein